jgi:predicted nucleic acid-binding protein
VIYVNDTNILVLLITNPQFEAFFYQRYLNRSSNRFIVSAVTEGEIRGLAKSRRWGSQKLRQLELALDYHIIAPIKNREMIEAYADIYAYSQGKLLEKPLPKGMSARNMGKNDLWIAATTLTAKATLITTDNDFRHLQDSYFPIDFLNIEDWK